MLHAGPSGFQNAPITKSIMIMTGFFSVGASMMKIQNQLDFPDLASIILEYQPWRLVTSHFFFISPGELLFGLILIYYFRLFERQMGSAKFGGYTFSIFTLSSLLQIASHVLFSSVKFIPGPYSFIFASFILYYSQIPSTYRFRIAGISATDKLFTYILGLQLFFSNSPYSMYSSLCGIISGVIYQFDPLGLKRFRLPSFINNFCKKWILPLIQSPRRPQNRPIPLPNAASGRSAAIANLFQQQMPFGQGYSDQLLPRNAPFGGQVLQPPSDESIEMLTNMGFSRQAALEALARCDNNVEMATHILLDS